MDHMNTARRVLAKLTAIERGDGAFDMATLDTWDWPQGVALYAMMKAYRAGGDAAFLDAVRDVLRRYFGAPEPQRNINTASVMLAVCELYALSPDETLKARIHSWADWAMHDLARTQGGGFQHATIESDNAGQLWDDSLYMTGLFLYRAGMLFGREDWKQEAVYQFLFHIRYLQNPQSGLFYHGFTFSGRHHFAGALWARGNSWITAGCADLLEWMDEDSADRRFILHAWQAQCEALLAVQDSETGRWHTLLDDPDSYLETSASAAIAYGLLKGTRLGLLPQSYRSAAVRASRGVCAMIREDGHVDGVSTGTVVHDTLEYYRRVALRPTAYGQGLTFLMLTEPM